MSQVVVVVVVMVVSPVKRWNEEALKGGGVKVKSGQESWNVNVIALVAFK